MAAAPTAEQTFDANVKAGTSQTLPSSITETMAGPTATTSQVIQGAGYTLTGDGVDPALSVKGSGTLLNLDNLNIANTGGAPSVAISAGATVEFGDGRRWRS